MKKEKIKKLPVEIQELNLSDNIKKYIYDKGITSIEELKKIRFSDFPDCSNRKVRIILNEVSPGVETYDPVNRSQKLDELKEAYDKLKSTNKMSFHTSRAINIIRTVVLNTSVLELDISLKTTLELKKGNLMTVKDVLEYVYGEDGTINYVKDSFDLKRLMKLADDFNLIFKNDPRIALMYNKDIAMNYNIEVLNLYGAENGLKKNGIFTIGDLLRKNKSELCEMIGRVRVERIIDALSSYSLFLEGDEKKYSDKDSIEKIQNCINLL